MKAALKDTSKLYPVCALLLAALLLTACNNDPVATEALASASGYSDVDGVRLEVGQPAADFTLTDYRGNAVTLSDYRGKSNVMLLFYRGEWCPFCVSHLEDLQSLLPSLTDYGIQLLALSPDNAEDSQELAQRFEQPYLFLSDSDLQIADRYGIRRDEELPHPAVVLIDKQGTVVWYYVGENYRQRPSSSQLQQVFKRVF